MANNAAVEDDRLQPVVRELTAVHQVWWFTTGEETLRKPPHHASATWAARKSEIKTFKKVSKKDSALISAREGLLVQHAKQVQRKKRF